MQRGGDARSAPHPQGRRSVVVVNFPGGDELPLLESTPIRMMGLSLARLNEEQVIANALDGIRDGRGGWICPVNLDVLRKVVRDPRERALVERADLRVADGMPLIWA